MRDFIGEFSPGGRGLGNGGLKTMVSCMQTNVSITIHFEGLAPNDNSHNLVKI
jgi:hypothetical protein